MAGIYLPLVALLWTLQLCCCGWSLLLPGVHAVTPPSVARHATTTTAAAATSPFANKDSDKSENPAESRPITIGFHEDSSSIGSLTSSPSDEVDSILRTPRSDGSAPRRRNSWASADDSAPKSSLRKGPSKENLHVGFADVTPSPQPKQYRRLKRIVTGRSLETSSSSDDLLTLGVSRPPRYTESIFPTHVHDSGSWDTEVTSLNRVKNHGITLKFTQENVNETLEAMMGLAFHRHGEWPKIVRLMIPEKDRVYTAAGITLTVRNIKVTHLVRPRSASIRLKDGCIEMSYQGVSAAFKVSVSIASPELLGFGKFEYTTDISTHVDNMDFTALLLPEFIEKEKLDQMRPSFSPFHNANAGVSSSKEDLRTNDESFYEKENWQSDRRFYAHVKDVKLDFGGKLDVSIQSMFPFNIVAGWMNRTLKVFDRWFRFIFRPALRQVLIYVLKWQGPAAIQGAFMDIVKLTKESADEALEDFNVSMNLVENVDFMRPVIAIRGDSVFWAFDVLLRRVPEPTMSQKEFDLWYATKPPRHWNHGTENPEKAVDFWNDPASPNEGKLWKVFQRRRKSCQLNSNDCKETKQHQDEWLRAKTVVLASRDDASLAGFVAKPTKKSLRGRLLSCFNGICRWKSTKSTAHTTEPPTPVVTKPSFWQRFKSWPRRSWNRFQQWLQPTKTTTTATSTTADSATTPEQPDSSESFSSAMDHQAESFQSARSSYTDEHNLGSSDPDFTEDPQHQVGRSDDQSTSLAVFGSEFAHVELDGVHVEYYTNNDAAVVQ